MICFARPAVISPISLAFALVPSCCSFVLWQPYVAAEKAAHLLKFLRAMLERTRNNQVVVVYAREINDASSVSYSLLVHVSETHVLVFFCKP
jgi:hypothetical protein